jgi:hypothetical protein
VELSLTDRGTPTPRSASPLNLVFEITRNDEAPIFFDLVSGLFLATINENSAIGSEVKTVSASDSDPDVSYYFFYIRNTKYIHDLLLCFISLILLVT